MLQAKRQGRRWPRRRVLRWVLGGVAGLVVVAVLAAVAFTLVLGRTFDDGRKTLAQPFPSVRAPRPAGAASASVNILLLGQDADSVDGQRPQFIGKDEADTVMLVHVPADRQHLYVMSILRYSNVEVPNHGMQPLNTAMAIGGVPLQVQTVEQLLGVRLDHVVTLDLAGMKDLTDSLGGVSVQNPVRFTNDGYTFAPGAQRLTGAQALAYVRNGAHGAAGDNTRAQAQAAYFRGVLEDVFRAKTLLNPPALATTVSVVSPYLTVDKGFDSAYVGGLGFSLRNLRSDDVEMMTLPTTGTRAVNGVDVLEVDQAALARVRQALRDDSFDELAR